MYAIINLTMGVAIYEVLFVFYSYQNDDTEMATFDRHVLLTLHDSGAWLTYSGKILISV